MVLGPRLDLRVSQTLVVSPQLQVAIRLLALSNLELEAEIRAEVERNPLLELASDGSEEAADTGGDPDPGAPGPPDGEQAEGLAAAARLAGEEQALDAPPEADLDADIEERFPGDGAADRAGPAGDENRAILENLGDRGKTLAEHLSEQAGTALAGPDLAVALHLIGLLDEAGYLTEPLEEVALRLGIDLAQAERVLKVIQTFEPTGVGARNLAECLAIQAREADRYDPCMQALIAHLDMVARGDLARLKRVCGVDDEDLRDMLAELRRYDPKPGLAFGDRPVQPVVPDVFVRRTAEGWAVELNTATLPRLVLNRRYHAELRARAAGARGRGRAERQFLDSCASRAQWLIRALDQRANTILRVSTEIVRQQEAFFLHGVSHLKPMTMRGLAEALELHESTVSRVAANKYLSCSRGVFELRSFFTHAVPAGSGADVSVEAVKARLRALIAAEDPLRPLSDDQLVELLRAEGHAMARRTVAKYRESLHIPSSFERRRRARIAPAG